MKKDSKAFIEYPKHTHQPQGRKRTIYHTCSACNKEIEMFDAYCKHCGVKFKWQSHAELFGRQEAADV